MIKKYYKYIKESNSSVDQYDGFITSLEVNNKFGYSNIEGGINYMKKLLKGKMIEAKMFLPKYGEIVKFKVKNVIKPDDRNFQLIDENGISYEPIHDEPIKYKLLEEDIKKREEYELKIKIIDPYNEDDWDDDV